MEKISFSIDNTEIIDENPDSNFAVVSLDFFSSGMNLHDMYVSEDTLMRTANTIKNCPIVWKFDSQSDDAYTHDKDEVPCGFVPEKSEIERKHLKDGRVMLSVIAYVWKRYTGKLLEIFRRDGGQKPISVEMSVYEMEDKGGITELIDFKYEGITVLGSEVTPAIPLANANVLSFADIKKEYNEDVEKEFCKEQPDKIHMKIPKEVKDNAVKGMELMKNYAKGATSIEIATARYLINMDEISPNKAAFISAYFLEHEEDSDQEEKLSGKNIAWLLFGGDECKIWSQDVVNKLKEEKEENMAKKAQLLTFPYKSTKDINPALKGIKPPINLAQANEIAKQADAVGVDEDKNGWAIAISNFKKTHTVKDSVWVKKEAVPKKESSSQEEIQEVYLEETLGKEEQEMGIIGKKVVEETLDEKSLEEKNSEELFEEDVEKKEELAVEEEKEEEKEELAAEEEKEEEKEEELAAEEDDKEDDKEEEKEDMAVEDDKEETKELSQEVKMAFAIGKILKLCKKEAPAFRAMKDEYGDGVVKLFEEFAVDVSEGTFDFSINISKMLTTLFKNTIDKVKKASLDLTEAREEIVALKKFKTDSEREKFEFEVNSVLSEAYEAGMSKDDIAAFREKALEFSLDTIDAFKNMVKAKAFVFVNTTKRNERQPGFVKIGMPFTEEKVKPDQIWE